jgi:hypothetical protein
MSIFKVINYVGVENFEFIYITTFIISVENM